MDGLTFAASIYVQSKLHVIQFKHRFPGIWTPSPDEILVMKCRGGHLFAYIGLKMTKLRSVAKQPIDTDTLFFLLQMSHARCILRLF